MVHAHLVLVLVDVPGGDRLPDVRRRHAEPDVGALVARRGGQAVVDHRDLQLVDLVDDGGVGDRAALTHQGERMVLLHDLLECRTPHRGVSLVVPDVEAQAVSADAPLGVHRLHPGLLGAVGVTGVEGSALGDEPTDDDGAPRGKDAAPGCGRRGRGGPRRRARGPARAGSHRPGPGSGRRRSARGDGSPAVRRRALGQRRGDTHRAVAVTAAGHVIHQRAGEDRRHHQAQTEGGDEEPLSADGRPSPSRRPTEYNTF